MGKTRLVLASVLVLTVLAVACGGGSSPPAAFERIAFVQASLAAGDVYTVRPDGSGLARLAKAAQMPAWSPDGTRIAFLTAVEGGDGVLHVMDGDGSGKRDLTSSASLACCISTLAWSPDGSRIAFMTGRTNTAGGGSDVYVVNADGSALTPVTKDGRASGSFVAPTLSWSPDGARVAFIGVEAPGSSSKSAFLSDVFVVNIDGSGVKRLTTTNASRETAPNAVAWSPDGGHIAFSNEGLGISVMSADGSGRVKLTRALGDTVAGPEYDFVWSPDGRRLAFDAAPRGTRQIFVVNADGTALTNLSNSRIQETEPTWSPDGRRLAFVSYAAGSGFNIHVMNDDGSSRRQVTRFSASAFIGQPVWSPGAASDASGRAR